MGLRNCGVGILSYEDEFVDFASGHVTLVTKLNAEIPEYYISTAFASARHAAHTVRSCRGRDLSLRRPQERSILHA